MRGRFEKGVACDVLADAPQQSYGLSRHRGGAKPTRRDPWGQAPPADGKAARVTTRNLGRVARREVVEIVHPGARETGILMLNTKAGAMVTSTVYAHVLAKQASQAAGTCARVAGID